MRIQPTLDYFLRRMLETCHPQGGSLSYDEHFRLIETTNPKAPSGVSVLDSEDWKAGWVAAVKCLKSDFALIRNLDRATLQRLYGKPPRRPK